MNGRSRGLAALVAVALGGCGPYAELGQKLDVGGTFSGEVWIAAAGPEARVLVLGEPAAGAATPFAFTSMAIPIAAGVSGWAVQGTIEGGPADATLTVVEKLRYALDDERGTPLLNRHGSTRESIDRTLSFGQRRSGEQLVLTGDATMAGTYVRLAQAMTRLVASTPADAACAFHLANLAVLSSQVRIIGFGSAGMSQYQTPATFQGTFTGSVRVAVRGTLSVTTDITYAGFSDFPGVRLDGTQTTHVNSGGNGYMSGVVAIALLPAAGSPELDGTIGYGPGANVGDAIQISGGSPSGGRYHVTLGGGGAVATVDPMASPSPSLATCLGLP